MDTHNPLHQACPHIVTPEEQNRDAVYLACNAKPGAPCVWAKRYDGVANPTFHAQRLEAAMPLAPSWSTIAPEVRERFDEDVLATGLV